MCLVDFKPETLDLSAVVGLEKTPANKGAGYHRFHCNTSGDSLLRSDGGPLI